jgi:hypothetical protein
VSDGVSFPKTGPSPSAGRHQVHGGCLPWRCIRHGVREPDGPAACQALFVCCPMHSRAYCSRGRLDSPKKSRQGSPGSSFHLAGRSIQNELFDICSERTPDPPDQRKRLLSALYDDVDVNATDKNGVTALHHAVRFRSPTAVKTLIERGANVNQACRRNGSTPLHRAVTQTGAPGTAGREKAKEEIVRLLVAAGADPSIANHVGRKPEGYTSNETIRELLQSATAG